MKIRIGGWSTDSGSLTIERLEEHEAEGKFEVFTLARETAALPAVGQAIRIGETEKQLGKKEYDPRGTFALHPLPRTDAPQL